MNSASIRNFEMQFGLGRTTVPRIVKSLVQTASGCEGELMLKMLSSKCSISNFESCSVGIVAAALHKSAHTLDASDVAMKVTRILPERKRSDKSRPSRLQPKYLVLALVATLLNVVLILSLYWCTMLGLANFVFPVVSPLQIVDSPGSHSACRLQQICQDHLPIASGLSAFPDNPPSSHRDGSASGAAVARSNYEIHSERKGR